MKAYPSGWQAGLQGLSDTLGGTAEFQRDTQTIKARQSLAERELDQRAQEEQRRQQAFQFDMEQARRKAEQERATQQAYYGMAQQALGQDTDELFTHLLGGQPDPGKEMGRIGALAKHLKPENAEQLLGEIRQEKAKGTVVQGLTAFQQELARPVAEGVQDPEVQQQIGLIQQATQQVAQMVQTGAIQPEDALRFIDQAMERQQSALQGFAKRQADLQTRQATVQGIEMHKQGMMPGDPRLQKLNEMQQLAGLGMMDGKQVGIQLMAEQFGISDEEMSDFKAFQEARQAERTLEAVTAPLRAIAGTMQDIGMQNGQATPRGKLVQLRNAVRSAQSPEEIDQIAAQLGIQDLTPEEEAFVRGG